MCCISIMLIRDVGYGDNLVIECDHLIYRSLRDDIFNFFNIEVYDGNGDRVESGPISVQLHVKDV